MEKNIKVINGTAKNVNGIFLKVNNVTSKNVNEKKRKLKNFLR